MSNLLTFGGHEGKSFEWLFFHAPWYAEWMYDQNIHRDPYKFSEEQGDRFEELMRRAGCLAGTCRWCNERPVTRMGLSTHFRSGVLGYVAFYCDQCEYLGGSQTSYHRPSFFVDTHTLPRGEQKRIVGVIKNLYVGGYERLTQARMEAFFRHDAFFADATPGFFDRVPEMSASG